MIRAARLDDAPTIARLGKQFHGEAGWSDIAEFDEVHCEATIRGLIESPDGIILVADDGEIVGFAGGVMFPLYFNANHRSGQELFWWVRPDHRRGVGGRLLDALEDGARAAGCVSWVMIALDKVHPAAMGRLYERRGYRASEHSYIKVL